MSAKNKHPLSKLQTRYRFVESAKVGEDVECPSCRTIFTKKRSQQRFCTSKPGTQCKDYFWNHITPIKRNNTTRISPANDAYMRKHQIGKYKVEREVDFDDDQSWDAHKDTM